MCDQQRLRPACAYTQSDQSLCLSLEYSLTPKLLTEHDLEFLSLKGGCIDRSESTLVNMPHCWKSHVAAQMGSAATSYGVKLNIFFDSEHSKKDILISRIMIKQQTCSCAQSACLSNQPVLCAKRIANVKVT